MAKMFPQRPPQDAGLRAEKRVFESFASGLDNSYTVFHSVKWLSRVPGKGACDGEADFVIFHPKKGCLVLEVKGGSISYDSATNQWTSTGKSGPKAIKDPVEQAKRSKYALLEKFKEIRDLQRAHIEVGHAVAFPDMPVDREDLRIDIPRDILIGAYDLEKIQSCVERAFAYQSNPRFPQRHQPEIVNRLLDLLAPSWDFKPVLGLEIAREKQAARKLTEEQFRYLDFLQGQRRAAIAGCAGSGKTCLALEKARRLASQDMRVLFTCFNKKLARHASESLNNPNITATNFHDLCEKLVHKAKGRRKNPPRHDAEYYHHLLPAECLDVLGQLPDRWDAVIVDEGQDMKLDYWVVLESLLHNPGKGIFYVFYDNNQAIYEPPADMPIPAAPNPLTLNCRNTRRIFEKVMSFYKGDVPIDTGGPEGREVETIIVKDDGEERKALADLLRRLVEEEHLSTGQVVLLTTCSPNTSRFGNRVGLGKYHLTRDPELVDGRTFYLSTIQSFKGLEADVVVLLEIEKKKAYHMELMYVGFSRAKSHVVVLRRE